MPRGVKIQKIALNKHSQEDINLMRQMFDQMTGMTNADVEVILPKYMKLRQLLFNFVKTYNILIDFKPLHETFPEFKVELDDISAFVNSIIKECNIDTASGEEKIEKYQNLSQDELNMAYKNLKEHACVKTIITTAGKLSRHEKMLKDRTDLKDGFIKREPGISMYLLSFSDLDFKALWMSPKITPIIKKFILTILSHTYELSFAIYDIITSPDIDIKKFSKVLITSLDGLRKQIPRCDEAFNIIIKSVELLEGNFKSYYKNSIEAENPSLILENFVIDVSTQQQSTGPRVTQQFRKIIMHMRKAASSNKDPRVKRLFNMLNTQFKAMEEQTSHPSKTRGESDDNKETSQTQETDELEPLEPFDDLTLDNSENESDSSHNEETHSNEKSEESK